MRIVCPSCAAEYNVPESRLRSRKLVRCVRCGGEWAPVEEAGEPNRAPPPPDRALPAPAEAAASIPVVTAMDHLASASPPARRSMGLIAAWIVTAAALAAAVAATVVWRDAVVRSWPPSGRILGAADTAAPASVRTTGKTAE